MPALSSIAVTDSPEGLFRMTGLQLRHFCIAAREGTEQPRSDRQAYMQYGT